MRDLCKVDSLLLFPLEERDVVDMIRYHRLLIRLIRSEKENYSIHYNNLLVSECEDSKSSRKEVDEPRMRI